MKATVIVPLAALWVVGAILASGGLPSDPGPGPGYAMNLTMMWAFVAVPWLFAIRSGAGSAVDGPGRLLGLAVDSLPDNRREWGEAMLAELSQVEGRPERWRFALSCLPVAIFPPRHDRAPIVIVAAVCAAAVAVVALTIGQNLPALKVFAVAFAGLLGLFATLAVARSRRVRLTSTVAGFVAVAACVGIVTYFLLRQHAFSADLPPATAILLAVILAGCLWLMVIPPRGLRTDPLVLGIAVVTAILLGAGVTAASRLGLDGVGVFKVGLFLYFFFAPIVAISAASAIAARLGRSRQAGISAAVWTALLGSAAVFAVGLFEALRWHRLGAGLIFDGEGGFQPGDNIHGFVWGLVLLPLWWLPYGLIAARLAEGRGRGSAVVPR